MKSSFNFSGEPVGDRYDNKVKVGDKELIVNTSMENHRYVNRHAVVRSVPKAFKTPIEVGDIILVHFNMFRRYYDVRGNEKNSGSYFKDNKYFATAEQIYMYSKNDEWIPNLDYCFVKPIKETDPWTTRKEVPLRGIIKYVNSSLEAAGIASNDLVGFKPNSEFEFIVDGERLYCMKSNDIVIKYERKGNEEEYNPSWSKGSGGIDKSS